MKNLELKTEKRDVFGKKLASLREKDKLPAVVYGPKEKSAPIFISSSAFKKVFKEAGESTIVSLDIEGKKHDVLIHEIDIDPVMNEPRHVDFYAVDVTKTTTVVVPLEFEGIAPAVKNLGGILIKVKNEIEVEALPKDLPHEIKIDVSTLAEIGSKVTIADIPAPKGVKILGNPEEVVALTEMPKEEVVPEAAPTIADIEVTSEKKETKEGEEEGSGDEGEKKAE